MKDETFRPASIIRVSVTGAFCFWLAVLFIAVVVDEVPIRTYVEIVVILTFFFIAAFHYGRLRVVVNETGVSYHGLLKSLHFRWDDVKNLVITGKGMFTGYHVLSANKSFTFTVVIKGHRELARVILQRASLERPVMI